MHNIHASSFYAENVQTFTAVLMIKPALIGSLIISLNRSSTRFSTLAGDGFYALPEDTPAAPTENAFAAVVADAQTLVSGAVIRLRLAQPMMINGHVIPADEWMVGTVQLNGERLLVEVRHLRIGQLLLPVKLSVYDADGLPGIYIPGAITRDVVKQSAAQSMSSLGLGSFDPSISAQAASAGIQAAKTLLQKKVQQVRVTVPAGYTVYLKNN